MKNNRKKVLLKQMKTVLFACLLMIGTIFAWNLSTEHVYAAEPQKVDDYLVKQYSDITEYRQKDNLKIPEAYDNDKAESSKWLFAGWYTNDACTSSLGSGSVCTGNKTMQGTYYAKFVSADVLSVKCQITKNTSSTSDSTKLRCVSSVDSLKYKKIGFELITPECTKYMESSKVGTRIHATDASIDYSYSPKVVDTESEYFFSAIETIEKDNFDKGYIVQPYWITKDGTKVYGVNKYVTVMEGVTDRTNTTIHIPVKMDAEPTGALTVTGGDATAVSCVEYKDGYAHFAITVADRRELKSATKFVIKEGGTEIASYIYRNLSSQYDGTDAKKDDSWYSVYSNADTSEDEFVIATSADLYGFAKAVTSSNKFDNKTVYLVNDIEANKGTANKDNLTWDKATDNNGQVIEPYPWTAIGSTNDKYVFNGVFDGQMHTISGLYMDTSVSYNGLFSGTEANAEIRNFYLKNSYFKTTGGQQFGSVVGNAKGTFENIYSDAIMLGTGGQYVGGLLGSTSTQGSVTVSNCWFAGSVISQNAASYFGGLISRIANSTTITNCLNSGMIALNANPGTEATGGIVGGVTAGSATIRYSVNTREVTTQDTASTASRGLLIGYHPGGTISIENSHAFNQSNLTNFVYNTNNELYQSTCGRYSLSEVAGLKSLTQAKIGRLFTDPDAKGYWSITNDGFPVLTTFEQGSGVTAQAVDTSWYDGSGEYVLKDSGDLYGLALLSQTNGFDNATIKLGADIEVNKGKALTTGWDKSQAANGTDFLWMPIGNINYPFNGEFDGQMHTISGIYLNSSSARNGMFSATGTSAEIRNFYLKNSYFTATTAKLGSIIGEAKGTLETIYSDAIVASYNKGDQVGGIIGATSTDGGVIMNDCWFAGSATINEAASYLGGLIGAVQSSSTIKNCLNTATLRHNGDVGTAGMGGLVGYAEAVVNISYSINTGDVQRAYSRSQHYGLLVGRVGNAPVITYSHSVLYYNEYRPTIAKQLVGAASNEGTSPDNCHRFSEGDLAGLKALTGTTTPLGNVKRLFIDNDARGHWSITKDSFPVLSIFEKGCDVVSQAVDTSWYDKDKDEFILMDSGDLYGLALLSKTNTFAGTDFKLGADITVNKDIANPDFAWMSICPSSSYTFQGDFDGQMHTISGLYQNSTNQLQGLFGDVLGGKITNLVIEDSYFEYSGSHQFAFIGALAGRATGSIENVYVNSTVKSSAEGTAGLVGATTTAKSTDGSDRSLTLVNCWNAGNISSKKPATAGLIGRVDKTVTMKNCLNTGTISTSHTETDKYIGGLIGQIDTSGTINLYNSLNTGRIEFEGDSASQYGMLIGQLTGNTHFNDVYTVKQDDMPAYHQVEVKDEVSENVPHDREDITFDLETIKGTDAFINMPGLFAGEGEDYWVCVEDGAPVLSFFAKQVGVNTIQAVDFSATEKDVKKLTGLYTGRKLYQGELHDHADTSVGSNNGTSDGYTELDKWFLQMKDKGLDFAASLDHRQASHIDLDIWDESKLIYGTEASTRVDYLNQYHYNMLFKSKDDFKRILEISDFGFKYLDSSLQNVSWEERGNNGKEEFDYPDFTEAEFKKLIEEVQRDKKGFFVLPHPLNYKLNFIQGIEPYAFADGIGLEVMYAPNGTDEGQKMYEGWTKLLADGHKIFACAGSDSHRDLNNKALTSIYAKVEDNHELCTTKAEKADCPSTECNKGNMIETLAEGNFVAGSVGIKMSVGDTLMGGTCNFANQRVVVDVDKIHASAYDASHKYRLDVLNEQGIVCFKYLTFTKDSETDDMLGDDLAFNADAECKLYRVVITDVTTGKRIAIGNPIWNSNK